MNNILNSSEVRAALLKKTQTTNSHCQEDQLLDETWSSLVHKM